VPRRNLDYLQGGIDEIEVISTDVFDTLLQRNGKSERSRIVVGEARFARVLKERGLDIHADELVRARLLSQKFAYRALDTGGGAGEVCLTEVIRRQLTILGVPATMAEERLNIEIAIEKASLSANGVLARLLRRHRLAGIRVVAVSDTGLPASRLAELIDYFHGPGLIDRVYSSADVGASKRQGGLFSVVLAEEAISPSKMLHIGDDHTADLRVPGSMGINTVHIPTHRLKRLASRADGGTTEARRWIGRRMRQCDLPTPEPTEEASFGERVFGPIVAQFCLFIWLYADQARVGNDTAILFCARGGIGIREAFERVIGALGLPLDLTRDNLLVSRLVAARSAVVTKSPAVLDELGREFRDCSFADVVNALGGRNYNLPEPWHQRFEPTRFFSMFETAIGQDIFNDIRNQNDLFTHHLHQISGDANRIILCDTGLYGSTQRLLAAGFPDRRLETIQFARCNYKGLSEDHFSKVAGLVVEQNLYNPLKVETVILRYWQIIESLFEPAVQSVRHFRQKGDGEVVANSGDIRYGKLDPAEGNHLLSGAFRYIDGVTDGAQILRDADNAWLRLKQVITNPSQKDLMVFGVGVRSVDFGRPNTVQILNQTQTADIIAKLRAVKSHLWREGAIARDFYLLKPPLLAALEMVHLWRGVSARWRR
jgi:FMN phosphatase YigB (HAD superfamily)